MISLALVFAAVGAIGCDEAPKPGGKCLMSQEKQLVACHGPGAALLCQNIRLSEVPCRGPKGCSGAAPVCDESVAKEGDPCTTDGAKETACSSDMKSTLVCRDGRFAVGRACRGPKGCMPTFDVPDCDQTLAEAGDPCLHVSGPTACSVDRKALLECKEDPSLVPSKVSGAWRGPNGRFAVVSECPTSKGCLVQPWTRMDTIYPVCDYRGVSAGDRCGRGFENTLMCSADGAALLKCDPSSLTFGVALTCAKGQRCEPLRGDENKVYPGVECRATGPAR